MASQTVTRPDTDTETRTRRQPPYHVLIHNDEWNGTDFVVGVLRKVFGYEVPRCVELMMQAHEKGRCVVWTGPLEVAELKAEQIRAEGPDPGSRHPNVQPLAVSVEPAA